ncbi:MAG: hypothetical protein H0T76_10565 [Nannocystis sp.]|nr:hypothetical protein [Nannocystis sp.]MBA3546915.1 hypothetical protein [Nannocystis sp.]
MFRRLLVLAVPLLACAGQPRGEEPAPGQPRQEPAKPVAPSPTMTATGPGTHRAAALQRSGASMPLGAAATEHARASLLALANGDGLIVSRAGGIVLLDAQLRQLAVLSPERGRHLRVVGEHLYFFAHKQPVLRAMNLSSGETRTIAELSRLKDACFSGGPPADPIDFVQSEADLSIAGGVLCLDIMDRNANMAAETRNFRIDLMTGAIEQRMVAHLSGDACGQLREREQPRLCTPVTHDGSGVIEKVGPSGRWSYYPDSSRGESGDRNYALARLTDRKQGRGYAIAGRKLRQLRSNSNPVGACLVPDENSAAWLGASDVLVLDGCSDRLTIVRPPDRVEHLRVDGFAVVPK